MAIIAAITHVDLALIVAVILFLGAGVMSVMVKYRSYVMALVSFGLAAFAFAFLVTP
jgi:hypothetical protein